MPALTVMTCEVGRGLDATGDVVDIDEWDLQTQLVWSVLVKGTAALMEDDDPMVEAAAALRPWATATERNIWMRIVPNEITGRRVT